MTSLHNLLHTKEMPSALREILLSLATAGKYINAEIRMKDTEKNKEENATGDTQSTLDIISDNIVAEALTQTNLVKTIASEERENVVINKDATEQYFVAYDPYDGGSVGDVNITFGSIFGIWEKDPMNDSAGKKLIAACYCLYGPRVTFACATKDSGVFLFELNEVGEFVLVRDAFAIKEDAFYFAPGNLKACATSEKYKSVVDNWILNARKLRYAGALVTDINHILLKEDGIFAYPADKDHPDGRLRLLYEGAPLSFMLEQAGGAGLTQKNTRILDEVVTNYHQRTTFFMGSKNEVENVVAAMQ